MEILQCLCKISWILTVLNFIVHSSKTEQGRLLLIFLILGSIYGKFKLRTFTFVWYGYAGLNTDAGQWK
jgi:hypothetical protein